MKKVLMVFIGLCMLTIAANAQRADDSAKIVKTIQHYFDGIMNSDIQALNAAFDSSATLSVVNSSKMLRRINYGNWSQFTQSGKKLDPASAVNKILSIQFQTNTAIVMTDLMWPGVHYVDYLILHKIQDEWKIVHKAWFQERR